MAAFFHHVCYAPSLDVTAAMDGHVAFSSVSVRVVESVLAKVELDVVEGPVGGFLHRRPLGHELAAQLLCLILVNEVVDIVEDHGGQLGRQPRAATDVVLALPPVALLGRDVCSGHDGHGRVDEEEGEDLAVARQPGVCKAEGLDAVHVEVGEEDGTALRREHGANVLDGALRVRAHGEGAVDGAGIGLRVVEIGGELFGVGGRAEGQPRGGDVLRVVVEEGRGTDVLVELALDVPRAAVVGGLSGVRWMLASFTMTCMRRASWKKPDVLTSSDVTGKTRFLGSSLSAASGGGTYASGRSMACVSLNHCWSRTPRGEVS